jgi:hypothetical protein
MSLTNAAQAALSQMLEQSDCKSMLTNISGRLNDIDLKLSLILDLLNKGGRNGQHQQQQQQQTNGIMDLHHNTAQTPSLTDSILHNATNMNNINSTLSSQLAAIVNSNANLLASPPPTSIFSDPTLASRLLAACQERPELSQTALSALMNSVPKMDALMPKLEPSENQMIWTSSASSTQPSPTDPSELMAAAVAAAAAAAGHHLVPSPSPAISNSHNHHHHHQMTTHLDDRHKSGGAGSADSKAFSDDVVDENDEEDEFDYEDEGDSPTATTSKHPSELSPPQDTVESNFPEGAVKRAAEKAARSFQSTQPKVFAWQILRESITDDELKNIQISLRTFHGETATHLLSRQLPKIRSVVEMTMRYFKWDALPDEAQLAKAKLLLSHLKNNAKVRNWTLREGRPNRSTQNADVLWRRYAALLGPQGFASLNNMNLLQQGNNNNNPTIPSSPAPTAAGNISGR